MPAFETSAKMDSEADHVESIFMTLVYKLKNAQTFHLNPESGEAGTPPIGSSSHGILDLKQTDSSQSNSLCC